MKVGIALIKFLLIGALFIVSNEALRLSDPGNISLFFNMFNAWLNNLFNQAIQITGYVANSEWLPRNSSLFSLTNIKFLMPFF